MKFPFHVTLLTLILILLVFTGLSIGLTYNLNTTHTVENLSQQVLGHAEKRIDQQVNHLLLAANEQCALNRSLLESRRFSKEDFPRLAAQWAKVMEHHRWFRTLGITLQSTGDGWYVRREPQDTLSLIEGHWNDGTRKLDLKVYAEADYPDGKPQEDHVQVDPREQPPYVKARGAGKQVWTETYMLGKRKGGEVEPDSPGLACATPIQMKDGSLLGVFTVTFDLRALCGFLKEISVGEDGFPFIVEYKTDHTRSVIAHPNPDLLFKKVEESPTRSHNELVPADQVSDARIRSFLAAVNQRHPDLVPSDLKHLTEAELRDLTQIRFTHDGVFYRGTYRCLETDQTPDWLICIVVPESSILGRVEQSNRQTLFILLGIGLAAVLLSLLVARWIAQPLRRLARQTEAIGQFHLAAEPIPHSIVTEVDRLAVAMENMKMSLRSFRKYVPAEVVRALLAAGQDASLGGENRTITIYFSDIADFTSIAEQLTPEQLVIQLAEYFSGQSDQILATQGTVDKYIGDAIMAFWGAPAANPGHALAACTAAVRNQEQLRILHDKWQAENKPPFTARIGLNTGEVIVGNIGSVARLNYTVIGDAVNLASRLEGLNKYYGTRILISESTYLQAKAGVVARPLDWVSVKGKSTSVLVYELLGLAGEMSQSNEDLVDVYTRALTSYRNQDWTRAIGLFEEVLRMQPPDQPAQEMIKRCRGYQATPPRNGWDGVHRMASK